MSVRFAPPERPGVVTVRDVLRLPCLSCAEVVAGEAGLDRPVRWVHVSELLDIARWLVGGEFLLTTGMKLREIGPAEQRDYALSLIQSGVAALGLELVLSLSEAPPPLVEVFEAAGVPLIVWREDLRFSAITEEVSRLLLGCRDMEFRLDEDELAEELLAGQSLEPLLRERLEVNGLVVGDWVTVMVFDAERVGGENGSAWRTRLVHYLRHMVVPARAGVGRANGARLACSDRGRLVKLVLTGDAADALLVACGRIASMVKQEMESGRARVRVLVGVGRPRSSLSELPEALREAVAMMRFRWRSFPEGPIHIDEVRLARLVLAIPPRERLRIVRDELGPVLALAPAERDELLMTLNALLEENYNVTAAARRLHLRRQSVYRRMEKLEELLGVGLDRHVRRAVLLLALRSLDLLALDGLDGTSNPQSGENDS